jgi:hypothetical protein
MILRLKIGHVIKSTGVRNQISPEREKRVMLHRAYTFRCILLLRIYHHIIIKIIY